MNAIKSVLIKISIIFSFLLLTANVEAQDFVNGQIDYAANFSNYDALAFNDTSIEKETQETIFRKDLSVCIIPSSQQVIPSKKTSKVTPPKTKQIYGRESITFILGKDRNVGIPFYDEAFYYFANHPYDRTEFIITSCRSLLDVRNYLASYPTGNALPWSTINIVMSPTESNDLRVPIFPQGIKSNVENLEMMARQNDFPSLSSNQIDKHTTLYIHGAKVEKDSQLNIALDRLLFANESIAINPIFLDDSFAIELGE